MQHNSDFGVTFLALDFGERFEVVDTTKILKKSWQKNRAPGYVFLHGSWVSAFADHLVTQCAAQPYQRHTATCMVVLTCAWDLCVLPPFCPTVLKECPRTKSPLDRTINMQKSMDLMAHVGEWWPNSANKPAQQLLYKTSQSHRNVRLVSIKPWRRWFTIH
jgi:hypothetical protein